MSSLLKRFVHGASWVLFGKIISASATLFANAILARLLTTTEMGAYFFLFSVVTFLSIFCQWGLNRGLVKIIATGLAGGSSEKVRAGIIASFALVLLTGIAVAALLITEAGSGILSGISGSQLLVPVSSIAGLWVLIKALQGLVSESFRGFHDILMATVFGGLVTAVLSMTAYFVLLTGGRPADLEQVVLIMIIASGISLFAGAGILARKIKRLDHGGKLDFPGITRFGFPLLITSIALLGVRELHIWLLAALQPENEVALYGSAMRLATLLAMSLIIVNSVIPPMVAELYSVKEYERVQTILQKTATLMSIPAIIIFSAIVIFGDHILGVIYGNAYTDAYIPFVILAGGQVVNVLSGSPGILLTMSGHERFIMKSALISGVLGVAITLIGARTYGATAAASGFAVGIIANNFAMWAYCRRRLCISTHGSIPVLRGILRKLRARIESDETNGGRLRIFARPVSFIEMLWWRMRGNEIVYCFGDSHAHIFRGLNSKEWVGEKRYRVFSVRGATAYGLGNPNSATNALQIFTHRLEKIPRKRRVLFMLGEVDVGFLVWLRARKQGISEKICMMDAFKIYTNFLTDVARSHPNITICSVQLPTIPDGVRHGNIANARREIEATQKERTVLTLEFNKLLKEWADNNGAQYIDFDVYALDKKTGLVKDRLLNRDAGNHHYDEDAFYSLIRKALVN